MGPYKVMWPGRDICMMKEEGDKDMIVIEVQDSVAITACERAKIRYTIITKNDIVIPPQEDDWHIPRFH